VPAPTGYHRAGRAGGAAYRYPTPGAATSPPATVSQPGDPIERDADAAADAALAGRAHDLLAASGGAVYRAATTGCVAPSEIVNVATASSFGHVAEALIEFDYCSLMGCSPFATDFFDVNIGAAPYIAFLAAHNSASPATIASWAVQAGLSGGILIPDILADRPDRKDYYEIKPNSIDGRPAGMAKLAAISAFMSFNSLPYVPGG